MDDPERTFTADIYRIWVVDESPSLIDNGRQTPFPSDIKGVDKEEWLAKRRLERAYASENLPEHSGATRWGRWKTGQIARESEREYDLIKARTITNTIDPDDSWEKLGMAERPYPMMELFKLANVPGAKVTHRDLDIGEAAVKMNRETYGVAPTWLGPGDQTDGDLTTWSRIYKLLVRDINDGKLELYRKAAVAPSEGLTSKLIIPNNDYDFGRIKKAHHLSLGLGEYLQTDMNSDLPLYHFRRGPLYEGSVDVTPDGDVFLNLEDGQTLQIAENYKWLKPTDDEMELITNIDWQARDDLQDMAEVYQDWDNHLRQVGPGGIGDADSITYRHNDVYDDMERLAASWVFGSAFDWSQQLRDRKVPVDSRYAYPHSRMIHAASPHRNQSGIVTFRGWTAWENLYGYYEPESRSGVAVPFTNYDYDASSYDLSITLPFFREGFGPGHAVLIETHMPYGTVGLHVGSYQMEHVLPPGTRWRYTYGQDNVVMVDSDYYTANPMYGINKVIYREVEPFALYGRAEPVEKPLQPAELQRYLDGLSLSDEGAVVELEHDIVAYMFRDMAEMHGVEYTLIPQANIEHNTFWENRIRLGSSLDMRSSKPGAVYDGGETAHNVSVMMEVHIPRGTRVRIRPTADEGTDYHILPPNLTQYAHNQLSWSLEAIELLYGDRVPEDLHALYQLLLPAGKVDRLYRVRYIDLTSKSDPLE